MNIAVIANPIINTAVLDGQAFTGQASPGSAAPAFAASLEAAAIRQTADNQPGENDNTVTAEQTQGQAMILLAALSGLGAAFSGYQDRQDLVSSPDHQTAPVITSDSVPTDLAKVLSAAGQAISAIMATADSQDRTSAAAPVSLAAEIKPVQNQTASQFSGVSHPADQSPGTVSGDLKSLAGNDTDKAAYIMRAAQDDQTSTHEDSSKEATGQANQNHAGSGPEKAGTGQQTIPTVAGQASPSAFELVRADSDSQPARPDEMPRPSGGDDIARQVIDRAQLRWRNGDQVIDIKLRPDSLGELQIRLVRDESGLTARISTNNSETGRLLTGQVAQMQDALQDKGVNVRQIDIQINAGSDPAAGRQSGQQPGQQHSQTETPAHPGLHRRPEQSPTAGRGNDINGDIAESRQIDTRVARSKINVLA